MDWLELIFWSAVGFVGYAYVGYPLLLGALALVRDRDVSRAPITPSVTLVITAYNEERRILGKIENALALSYPATLIEIIVASDCSSDQTDEIAKSYASRGVRLVRAPARKGKEAAQKLAVHEAKGEILVFSDVATILSEDAIAVCMMLYFSERSRIGRQNISLN